jgi:hypothetical protein
VDSGSAPGWILDSHADDLLAQILADGFSPGALPAAGQPGPVPRKPRPVPAHDGIGLDQDQSLFPARPNPAQNHPKEFVGSSKSGLRMAPFQNCELLTKSQVFQEKVAARKTRLNDQIEQELQRTEHELVVAEASWISVQTAFVACKLLKLHCGKEEFMC